ncbi:MAG: hypothetical protein WDN09_01075 [bacterium]
MKKVSLFLSIFLGFILTSAAAVKYPAKLSKWNAKRHVRTRDELHRPPYYRRQ